MNTLVTLLKNNPAALSRYVKVSTALIDRIVSPLNKFMAHLLVVQGIDPNTQPGQASRQALVDALNGVDDSEEFDKDLDSSWFNKQFDRARGKLSHLNTSKEFFRKATDLNNVSDKPTPLQVAINQAVEIQKSAAQSEQESKTLFYTVADQDKFAKVAKEKEALARSEKESIFTASGDLNISSLKNALQELQKYAASLPFASEESRPVKFEVGRQPVTIGRGRKTSSHNKIVKTFKNGLFRRVEEPKKGK
jgi:hypothetical protein